MVHRNAAWRERRRNPCHQTQAAYIEARREFHRTVRRSRTSFWETWLGEMEVLSMSNPRASAQQCRRQFARGPGGPPLTMVWPSYCSSRSAGDEPNAAAREMWLQHFASEGTQSEDSFDVPHGRRIKRRIARLLNTAPHAHPTLDAAFHVAELLRALPHCEDSSVGPDGFPFAMFRPDLPWWQSCVVDFCTLLLRSGAVPSGWKEAHVVPVWKRGERNRPSNYRPISLTSCFARLFERLILSRIGPIIDSRLDPCQAGFRLGSDEQAYVLQECLRLRQNSKTFCAFVDLENAFGSCRIDAALWRLNRGGVHGLLWKVIADLVRGGRSRVKAHGGLSGAGPDSGLGQGRVLSPLLFNLVMNGAAAAVQRACNGVKLGPEPWAPRITTLLYADDMVILAESPEELQRALDALSDWARRWRFSFSAGHETSAVLVSHARHTNLPSFNLGGIPLPVVDSYRYLGVVIDSKTKWSRHVAHTMARGRNKLAACVAWAQREGLSVGWRAQLFRAYVLIAFAFGSEFAAIDPVALRAFSRHLIAFGRRLLGWAQGSPTAAVVGDLGWQDGEEIALRRAASLWARLDAHSSSHPHSTLSGRVFQYARQQRHSWASWAESSFHSALVPSASRWGLGPGQPASLRNRWLRAAAYPALRACSIRRFRSAVARIPSLQEYSRLQPSPCLNPAVHNRRVAFADSRLWGLARCGHHPFCDGRSYRHRHGDDSIQCPFCWSQVDSLNHAIIACPGFVDLRALWLRRTNSQANQLEDVWGRIVFQANSLPANVVAANISFVAQVCRRRELCVLPHMFG